MTGYESKRAAAQDKLKCQCSMTTKLVGSGCQYCNPEYLDDDDDTQVYQDDTLTIAYQSGYYDGKKAAQPVQEPVAYLCKPDKHGLFDFPTPDKACEDCFPVYAAPPQRPWVGLTAEEILDLFDATNVYGSKWIEFARAVETKLKQKNT